MKQKAIASLPIFCKSEGEIFARVFTSDGGTASWVWRDGSWISVYFVRVFRDGISLSRDELISLIGRKAVESLPGGGDKSDAKKQSV